MMTPCVLCDLDFDIDLSDDDEVQVILLLTSADSQASFTSRLKTYLFNHYMQLDLSAMSPAALKL